MVILRGRTLVMALCGAQLANLLSHVAVPAVMAKHLVPLWHLSATEAGMMASAYTLGYFLAVPILVSLTDRIDARRVLLAGSIVIAVANIAFGLLADGWGSATLLWGLAGIGGAGTYMPGLRALTDRLDGGEPSRAISTYTASFTLAVGLSFLTSQFLADALGWRRAFVIMGLAPLVAMIVAGLIGSVTPEGKARLLPDFRAVLRNKAAMGYILGYGAHCFELYGFRTWIVPFWTAIVARHGSTSTLSPLAVSVAVSLIAFPASIFGNEGALRLGRHRLIVGVMSSSALVAFGVAASVTGPASLVLGLLLLYAVTLQGDLRRAYLRHGHERSRRRSRRHHGPALDGRVRHGGAGGHLDRPRARSRRWTGDRDGLVRRLRRDGSRQSRRRRHRPGDTRQAGTSFGPFLTAPNPWAMAASRLITADDT